MIVVKTNTYDDEYDFYCPKDSVPLWQESYLKLFGIEHQENVYIEIINENGDKFLNFYLATIPSCRKDRNGDICDVSIVGHNIRCNLANSEFVFFVNSMKFIFGQENGFIKYGQKMDEVLTKDDLDIYSGEAKYKPGVVKQILDKLVNQLGSKIIIECPDLPEPDEIREHCYQVIPLSNDNRMKFLSNILSALKGKSPNHKDLFVISQLSVLKKDNQLEKINKLYDMDSDELISALFLSSESQISQVGELKKKASNLAVVLVIILLLVGILEICLSDSKTHRQADQYSMVSTPSKDSLMVENDSSLSQIEMLKQQLKDSTIKYQYYPLYMEYDKTSNSIMIIRDDSVRLVFFSLE